MVPFWRIRGAGEGSALQVPFVELLVLLLILGLGSCVSRGRGPGGDGVEGQNAGECSDGADNDLDGLYDCLDPDCALSSDCSAGDDDDLGGDDDDISGDDDTSGDDDDGAVELNCADGIDNDGDGFVDCGDVDCYDDEACGGSGDDDDGSGELNCADGMDNDSDGLVDCADPDCAGDPACSGPGDDDDTTVQEFDCANGLDDDSDSLTDCADPDCAADDACGPGDDDDSSPATEFDCGNGVDDDGDGPVDCLDSDCSGDPLCPSSGDGVSCTSSSSLQCPGVGDTLEVFDDTAVSGVSNINLYSCATWNVQGPEIAYEFSSPAAVDVELYLTAFGPHQLRIFLLEDQGSGCIESACIDDGSPLLNFSAVAGVTYYIVVEGFSGWSGPYRLDLECN